MTIERMDFSDPGLRAWWSTAYSNGLHTDTPFQSLEWNESWWTAFGAPDDRRELFLLAGREADGSFRFIAPLYLQKRAIGGALAWEHLLWIGDDLAPYLDIVAPSSDKTDYLDRIVRYCEDQRPRAWLQLRDVPACGLAARASTPADSIARSVRTGPVCLRLGLAADAGTTSAEALLAAARGPFRRTLRKALARYADVSNELDWRYGPADDTMRTCLTALASERFGANAFLADARHAEFFRNVQDQLVRETRYAMLTAKGKPVHCVMGFEHSGVFHYFLSGMQPSASSFAPGIMNFALLIMHLRDNGIHALDFLRGDERYKRDFGGEESRTLHVRIVPPRARASHAAAGFLRGMRRMIERRHKQGRAA